MAEEQEEGTWEDGSGHFEADLEVRTISGHAYKVVTVVDYWCDVRTDLDRFTDKDIRGFRTDADDPDSVITAGEEVAWDDVPEHDRTEIETALEKLALEKATTFLRDSWLKGRHPFPHNAMADWA